MRVEPRVPVETADASRGAKGPRQFLTNTVLVVLFFVALWLSLGLIADGVVHVMPRRWEDRLSFGTPPDWRDERIPGEVQAIFERVRDASASPRPLTLHVIETDEINAMAVAGGHIGLTRGLLESVDSEEELAFVLAHEIGHLEHRHPLKRVSRSVLFGLVKTILFGGDPSAGLIDRAQTAADMRHSRRQELAADRFALDCLLRAYDHVGGATTFFESIRDRSATLVLLRTHPLSQSRIDRLESRIRRQALPVREVKPLVLERGQVS